MNKIKMCYRCAGISEAQHNKDILDKFFTADMHICKVCGESVDASSIVYKDEN